MKFWRFTTCETVGGLVIADTAEQAVEKIKRKYGEEVNDALFWSWEDDDFYDADNNDVFEIHG